MVRATKDSWAWLELQRACAYVRTYATSHTHFPMVSIIQPSLSGGAEAGLQDETGQEHQYQAVAELSSVNLSDEYEVETAW